MTLEPSKHDPIPETDIDAQNDIKPNESTESRWEILKGLFLCVIIAILSFGTKQLISKLSAVTAAIIIGIIVNTTGLTSKVKSFKSGIQFADKKLLPVAIALLGIQLNINDILDLGIGTVIIILSSITTAITVSILTAKLLGKQHNFGVLLGAGNAICGSSAIAAVAPELGSDEESIGLAVAVVNLLGVIGIFIAPVIGDYFLVDSSTTDGDTLVGTYIGATLQAVGQVVAAGFSVSDTTGNIATAVKMGRILMLGPLLLLLPLIRVKPAGPVTQGQAAVASTEMDQKESVADSVMSEPVEEAVQLEIPGQLEDVADDPNQPSDEGVEITVLSVSPEDQTVSIDSGVDDTAQSCPSSLISCLFSLPVPLFIIVFMLLCILNTVGMFSEGLKEVIDPVGDFILVTAMAGIGLKISLRAILKQGPKALCMGTIAWVCQSTVVLILCKQL